MKEETWYIRMGLIAKEQIREPIVVIVTPGCAVASEAASVTTGLVVIIVKFGSMSSTAMRLVTEPEESVTTTE